MKSSMSIFWEFSRSYDEFSCLLVRSKSFKDGNGMICLTTECTLHSRISIKSIRTFKLLYVDEWQADLSAHNPRTMHRLRPHQTLWSLAVDCISAVKFRTHTPRVARTRRRDTWRISQLLRTRGGQICRTCMRRHRTRPASRTPVKYRHNKIRKVRLHRLYTLSVNGP